MDEFEEDELNIDVDDLDWMLEEPTIDDLGLGDVTHSIDDYSGGYEGYYNE